MKHTFLKVNGQVTQFDRFMQGPTLLPGHEWRNAYENTWVEQPQQPSVDVNDTRLFGYEKEEFLQKQYRKGIVCN